jgi:hypothetical protein
VARTKVGKSAQAPAVRVSLNLQLAVLTFTSASVIVGIGSYWLTIASYGSSPSREYIIFSLTQMLYPAVVFFAAYLMTRPHHNIINRAFVAAVKAVAVCAVLGIFQSLYNQVLVMMMRDHTGQPSAWVTSSWPMFSIMAVTLLGYIGLQYYWNNKK